MQFKTMKPKRRALLSLAVMLTLAPVGAGVHHLLAPNETRTAATLADLGDGYEGGIWSNKDLDTQNTPATLEITSRTRNRFTGNLRIGEGDPLPTPVSGGVSAAGRVVLNGSINSGSFRLRISINSQLSAGGNALIGTYTASGRGAKGPFNDRGSIVMLVSVLPK